ncbi:MAG: ParB N-terminal domain-containing protein [Sulfurihydrogenibium sp.]|jgi:ParB-like chromosome segregation protein Spo0J|nr:ParB N-terminal domain-containing protein [Sulfurihydrogenibium sp.]
MKVIGIKEIPISEINIIQGLLPRVETHTVEEKVEEYKEAMEMGSEFPPISVWKKGNEYWLIDGMHRLMASKRIGKTTIKAEIVELENMIEAKIMAITKNRHGLPLTKEEKRILCQNLYMEGVPIPELQRIFGVSERTIYYWCNGLKRKENPEELREKAKELREKGYTQEEVATELGIPLGTIKRWDAEDKRFEPAIFADPNHKQFSEEEIDFDDKVEDKISYEKLLESATKNSKELSDYTRQRFEEEQRNYGGRPPNDLPPATEKEEIERIKDGLISHMEQIALKIGWAKALPMFEEALKEVKELSEKSKRGW